MGFSFYATRKTRFRMLTGKEQVEQDIPDRRADIQNGRFAEEFILENQAGTPKLKAMRRLGREHPIEAVGERLRDMMPWIKANKIVDKSKN